ncbi:MAG: lmo0937 family membrane protein [Candidatus Limnocylindria bacterium]
MLWFIVAILVGLWLLGLLLKLFAGFIHLLLIVALVVIIYRLVARRRVV